MRASPRVGTPSAVGDLADEVVDRVEAPLARDDDDRDAGIAQLLTHLLRADRGVGEDHGRRELEDRLGVERVPRLRDDGQVLRAGERRRRVAADDVIAEAEGEHGRRDRAGDVDRQDAVDIGDLDLAALGVRRP